VRACGFAALCLLAGLFTAAMIIAGLAGAL
jgi:hypothetical protein